MEDNLIKWQSIWKQQKSKPMQLNNIISRLNTIEKKAKRQRITLIFIFAVLVITSILRPVELFGEKFYLIAYILILLAIGVKFFPNLKGKYNLITNEAELNNRKFIKKLQEKMTFNTNYLLIFLLLATLGLNSALLGLYEKGTIFNFDFNSQNRVFIHLSTILIFIVGYIIHKKRVNQSQNEISDLIRELENMK
ncbi:MAG: hypothetical protein AB8F74_12255 [Saprospiraceae bacterium]